MKKINIKKLITMLFLVGFILCIREIEVKAVTAEVTIGDVEYATLQEALERGGEETYDKAEAITIVLKKDIILTESILLSKAVNEVTIDLNGKTISINREGNSQWSKYIPAFVTVNYSIVTIKNGTLKNVGKWDAEAQYQDLMIYQKMGKIFLENVKCYGNI